MKTVRDYVNVCADLGIKDIDILVPVAYGERCQPLFSSIVATDEFTLAYWIGDLDMLHAWRDGDSVTLFAATPGATSVEVSRMRQHLESDNPEYYSLWIREPHELDELLNA